MRSRDEHDDEVGSSGCANAQSLQLRSTRQDAAFRSEAFTVRPHGAPLLPPVTLLLQGFATAALAAAPPLPLAAPPPAQVAFPEGHQIDREEDAISDAGHAALPPPAAAAPMRAASPAEMKLVLTVIDAEEGGAEGSVGVKLVVENEEAPPPPPPSASSRDQPADNSEWSHVEDQPSDGGDWQYVDEQRLGGAAGGSSNSSGGNARADSEIAAADSALAPSDLNAARATAVPPKLAPRERAETYQDPFPTHSSPPPRFALQTQLQVRALLEHIARYKIVLGFAAAALADEPPLRLAALAEVTSAMSSMMAQLFEVLDNLEGAIDRFDYAINGAGHAALPPSPAGAAGSGGDSSDSSEPSEPSEPSASDDLSEASAPSVEQLAAPEVHAAMVEALAALSSTIVELHAQVEQLKGEVGRLKNTIKIGLVAALGVAACLFLYKLPAVRDTFSFCSSAVAPVLL